MPRALIVYNEPTLSADHPDAESEHDILFTVDTLVQILQQQQIPVSRLGLTTDPTILIDGLQRIQPNAIINLYEGIADWGQSEAYMAGCMELLNVPFSGSSAQPLMLCRSKTLTKQLLAGAGLSTARFLALEHGPIPQCPIPWPVIVKPAAEDASVGIDQNSVVTSQEQLEARVTYLRERYGASVLIEQFITGREFNVAVIEQDGVLRTLPFSEIFFKPPMHKPGLWPIVSFDAKWHPESEDFVATPVKNPADVEPALAEEVSRLAQQAFRLLGCRDYARIDFRVDEAGTPYILEVNPNPCISPLAGLAEGLASARIPYPEFVLNLFRAALKRGPFPKLADELLNRPIVTPPRAIPIDEPQQTVDVRMAEAEDAPAIGLVIDSIVEWNHDYRQSWLVCDPTNFWVRTVDERVVAVGVLGLSDLPNGSYNVDLLAVALSDRRQGHASALLEAMEEYVAEVQGRFLLAKVSSSPTDMAIRRLLQSMNYRPVGELPKFYRDDHTQLSFAKAIDAGNDTAVVEAA